MQKFSSFTFNVVRTIQGVGYMQLKEIGKVHSPYKEKVDTPKRTGDKTEARIEIHPEFREGLKDLEGFSHVYILCFLDRVTQWSNFAYPPNDGNKRGVFATRSPNRPNPISLSRVKLKEVRADYIIVEGLDMMDGTPLIDIKPYSGRIPEKPSFGWFEKSSMA
ncbi:MAG: tRNA (N6-threonylcarbamoyladenosine(37)-N6)-methyltransferase TrmO [Nanobdellota archaeon]